MLEEARKGWKGKEWNFPFNAVMSEHYFLQASVNEFIDPECLSVIKSHVCHQNLKSKYFSLIRTDFLSHVSISQSLP